MPLLFFQNSSRTASRRILLLLILSKKIEEMTNIASIMMILKVYFQMNKKNTSWVLVCLLKYLKR
jgi:hypothetical protein